MISVLVNERHDFRFENKQPLAGGGIQFGFITVPDCWCFDTRNGQVLIIIHIPDFCIKVDNVDVVKPCAEVFVFKENNHR